MNTVRVIGSRKMLDMPAGTIFIPIERRYVQDIYQFLKSGPINLNNYISDLYIYGSNNGSATINTDFEEPEEEYFYSDYNVVGDASPVTTLYIILDEDDIPSRLKLFMVWLQEPYKYLDNISCVTKEYNSNLKMWGYYKNVTKEEFLKIRENFLNENYPDRSVSTNDFDVWARTYLDNVAENQEILNLDIKMEVVDEQWVGV